MTNNKLAIVFPGQGSQSIGMLQDLNKDFPQIQDTFLQGSRALGYDLWDLAQNGPEEVLNQTEFTQPVLLAAGVCVWRILKDIIPVKPDFMAGHSLGEYTALVCSEALDFSDALRVVRDRGRFMQDAYSGKGAMVAIAGLPDDVINKICIEAAQNEFLVPAVLVPANYNSLGQTVLSGEFNAANRAIGIAKSLGAKIAKLLPVSIPSHCILMKPAADKLLSRLVQVVIKQPQIPVVQNADVAYYDDPSKIRDSLVRQLYSPVRWVETVQFLIKNGVSRILECGPGKILTGLNKRISSEITVDFTGNLEKITNLKNNQMI